MANPPRITLEELIALNDEMAALVRAGVPLGQGLSSMGHEMPGRLGKFTTTLSERLEKGESLEYAIGNLEESLPPVYRAVVAAGLRSGRLASALEGLSTTVRRVAELRRTMIAAMVYPVLVLALASLLMQFTITKLAPVVAMTYDHLGVERPPWYEWLLVFANWLPALVPWFWVLLAVGIVVWLYRSHRATVASARGLFGLSTLGRVVHAGRMATFAEVLALMVEQEVPMDEAVLLASSASGDVGLTRAGQRFAERVRQGDHTPEGTGLPPLLEWLLLRGAPQQHIVRSLRRTGESYRRRARYWGSWLSLYLPLILSALIGGTVTLFYVLLVFAPFYNLLFELS